MLMAKNTIISDQLYFLIGYALLIGLNRTIPTSYVGSTVKTSEGNIFIIINYHLNPALPRDNKDCIGTSVQALFKLIFLESF